MTVGALKNGELAKYHDMPYSWEVTTRSVGC